MVNGYKPTTLKEALSIRAGEKVIPYAGGTDLMVQNPKEAVYLFLNDIEELREIKEDDKYIRIGAAVTFTEALSSDLVPALMKEAVSRIAAPAIRNAGTFGGNIGNGSDKADSVLVEFAMGASVRLLSEKGERILPVREFCISRRVTAIRDDELIAEILLPKDKCSYSYYYQKVGGRNALAISRVAFAGAYDVRDGVIRDFSAAVLGSGGVFQRYKEIEDLIIGKTVDEFKANRDAYLSAYGEKLTFARGRVSAEYRKTVVLNLIRDYLESVG